MGFARVKGLLGGSEREAQEVDFLVDTGSRYTVIPPRLATTLGITPVVPTRAVVADNRVVEMGTSMAYLKLMDRDGAVPVGILGVPIPLLGVTALEILGLKVDPIKGILEHDWPFGPAVL